jgi:hypothetical protein
MYRRKMLTDDARTHNRINEIEASAKEAGTRENKTTTFAIFVSFRCFTTVILLF